MTPRRFRSFPTIALPKTTIGTRSSLGRTPRLLGYPIQTGLVCGLLVLTVGCGRSAAPTAEAPDTAGNVTQVAPPDEVRPEVAAEADTRPNEMSNGGAGLGGGGRSQAMRATLDSAGNAAVDSPDAVGPAGLPDPDPADLADARGDGVTSVLDPPAEEAAAADTAADPGPGLQPADPDRPLPGYEPYPEKSPLEAKAENAFGEPQGARRLSPEFNLWIDRDKTRLIVDGYVSLQEGPLEMFACPSGTKEHESVVAVLAESNAVHAGLLAIGTVQGTPVSFDPEYRPATGQRIAIWVLWKDDQGNVQKTRAQQWVQVTGTEEELQADWVFAGSSFWKDPESGREFYQADSGDLICVSNFPTATLDLPVESTQSNAGLVYSAYSDRIPPRGTPVRLVMMPIPLPGDGTTEDGAPKETADPTQPPEDQLLAVPAP